MEYFWASSSFFRGLKLSGTWIQFLIAWIGLGFAWITLSFAWIEGRFAWIGTAIAWIGTRVAWIDCSFCGLEFIKKALPFAGRALIYYFLNTWFTTRSAALPSSHTQNFSLKRSNCSCE